MISRDSLIRLLLILPKAKTILRSHLRKMRRLALPHPQNLRVAPADRDASPGRADGAVAQPSYAPEPAAAPPPKAQITDSESTTEVATRQKKEADKNETNRRENKKEHARELMKVRIRLLARRPQGVRPLLKARISGVPLRLENLRAVWERKPKTMKRRLALFPAEGFAGREAFGSILLSNRRRRQLS